MIQIIKLSQAYTESDLGFRFVIYAGFRFSCKYFACPNKYNCILVFTVSGSFTHQHTLQPLSPAPMGLVPVFRASSCNLGQECRERSCAKSPQAGVCLALWLILSLPPWFAFLAWTWPYLLAVPLPSHRWAAAHPSCCHQGCSAQLVRVLQDCAPTDTKLLLREPDMWLFQALVSKIKPAR